MLLAGVGPEAAARTAALALARCRPRTLISLGFGGALTPEAAPGTLVLGERFRQYDPDRGILAAAPGPAPPRLLAGLVRRLRDAGLPSLTGTIITAPRILHKAAEAGPLMELPCPVLDLESAPLAAAAAERGLAFLGLRAVTDGAGEEIPEFIREACRRGAEPGPAAAFAWAARDPRRLLMLLRLWRRSRLAGRLLARALEVLLPVL
jgi:adenosylhomocysteine nucleosidase